MKKIKTMNSKNLFCIYYVELENEEGKKEQTMMKVYGWTSTNGAYNRYYCLYSQLCKNPDNEYGAIQLFCDYGDYKNKLLKKYNLKIKIISSTGVDFC